MAGHSKAAFPKVWKKYGKNMELVWNKYGKSIEKVWNKYGKSMTRASQPSPAQKYGKSMDFFRM